MNAKIFYSLFIFIRVNSRLNPPSLGLDLHLPFSIMKFRYLLPMLLVAAGIYIAYQVNSEPYQIEVDITQVPTFSPVRLDFVHKYREAQSLPFLGSAIIDVDSDGKPEVFLGGGYSQHDGLFTYRDAQFVDIGDDVNLHKETADTTYGAASVDINNDGYSDLFVARDNGVYLYVNRQGTFIGGKLPLQLDTRAVPLSITAGDINRDGYADLFISCFLKPEYLRPRVFNDPNYGTQSLMLLNNGDNTFVDITADAGLKYTHNTFTALFADLDLDAWSDLAVADNTGQVRIYKNLRDNRFKSMPNPTSGRYGFPMGIAAGDVNNDGRPDLFFTNSGSTIPEFLARGDLHDDQRLHTKWMLLRNDGDFKFTDVAGDYMVADYEFGWGAVFADFNLDGLEDLVVADNYIHFLPQSLYRNPGRLLLQKENSTFAPVERFAQVENRQFGISPLVADFNNDGYPDLVQVNLDGPSMAYINLGGNAKFLKVNLGDAPATLGAQVSLSLNTGRRYTKQLITSQGLASDQTHIVTFGLGQQAGVSRLQVRYPSGAVLTVDEPALNGTLELRAELQATNAPDAAELPASLREDNRQADDEPSSREIPTPAKPAPAVQQEPAAPSSDIENELLQLLNE